MAFPFFGQWSPGFLDLSTFFLLTSLDISWDFVCEPEIAPQNLCRCLTSSFKILSIHQIPVETFSERALQNCWTKPGDQVNLLAHIRDLRTAFRTGSLKTSISVRLSIEWKERRAPAVGYHKTYRFNDYDELI